jgi:cysteine desulfurase
MSDPIYLDYNATTPLLPEVLEAMCHCYETPLLNPASHHEFGRRARYVLGNSRERIAELLGASVSADTDRVIFTGSGTEANNLAIFGLIGGRDAPPGQIILSSIEHPSISAAGDYLACKGWQVDRLGVDSDGVVRFDQLQTLLTPATRLVAVMLGNNETGVLQPVAKIAVICQEKNVPLHTDAAQVIGKLPVNFRELGVSSMSLAAHKCHGPLGIGALLVRHGTPLVNDQYGGPQQAQLRPGTESVPLSVGLSRALEAWHAERETRAMHLAELRDRFEALITASWPATVILGQNAPRLPHTSNIALVGMDRQALLLALDQAGVACSTGSACASGSSEPSPVHLAMGCPEQIWRSALRFSLGVPTTRPDVEEAAHRVIATVTRLSANNRG